MVGAGTHIAVTLIWNQVHNLTSTPNTSVPFESEYADRFASKALAWELPPALLKPKGPNSIHVVPKFGTASQYFTVLHVDVLLPVSRQKALKSDDDTLKRHLD